MAAVFASEPSPDVALRPQRSASARVRRAALVGSIALVTAVAWQFGAHHSPAAADPELALLMRGMAVIKGCLAVLGSAWVLWRLGLAISARVALAYAACLWLLFASSVLVWCRVSIPGAAVLFHAGELALLLVAWRESFPFPRLERARSRSS